jgi:hypothetical protein
MARRRVFQTEIECPGLSDLGLTSNRNAVIGRTVTLEKSASTSEVAVRLDSAVVGHLDNVVGPQVASAIDRGVSFRVVIKKAYQNYDHKFKPTTASIHLKVEYLLDKDQPPIKVPKAPGQICEAAPTSFFTTVAGVTFEGRQRVVARCSVGESLRLVRDPTNRYDKGAIKVMRFNGEQLGFIPVHVSRGDDPSGLALRMDRGDEYKCRIKDLTGGGGQNLGVNTEVAEGEEFDSVLSTAKRPAPLSVVPLHNNLGRLVGAAAVLLLILALIAHNWF